MGKTEPHLHIRHLREISLGSSETSRPPKSKKVQSQREDAEEYDTPATFDFQKSDHKGPIRHTRQDFVDLTSKGPSNISLMGPLCSLSLKSNIAGVSYFSASLLIELHYLFSFSRESERWLDSGTVNLELSLQFPSRLLFTCASE